MRSSCSSRSTLAEIEQIVDLQIEDVRRRLAERRVGLELTEAARG